MSLSLEFRETYVEQERHSAFMHWLGPRLRRIWGFSHFGLRRTKEWRASSGVTQIGEEGNVITMGGIGGELEKMGLATRTPATLLSNEGFIPVKGALDGVIDLVRSELLEEGEVTEDIAALVILLEKADIIKNYFSPYERGQMKDRLKAIVRSPQGRQVGRMVEYVEGMLSIMTVLMVMYQ